MARKSKTLLQIESYRDVRVSMDHTPRQVQYYKNFKTELQQRTADGEQLKIRYVKGIPKIVPLN